MFHDAFKYYNSTMLVTSSIIVNTRVLAPLLAKGHTSQLPEEDKLYIQVAEQKECLYSMGLRVLTFFLQPLQTLTKTYLFIIFTVYRYHKFQLLLSDVGK